jgi:hypothetical protein
MHIFTPEKEITMSGFEVSEEEEYLLTRLRQLSTESYCWAMVMAFRAIDGLTEADRKYGLPKRDPAERSWIGRP